MRLRTVEQHHDSRDQATLGHHTHRFLHLLQECLAPGEPEFVGIQARTAKIVVELIDGRHQRFVAQQQLAKEDMHHQHAAHQDQRQACIQRPMGRGNRHHEETEYRQRGRRIQVRAPKPQAIAQNDPDIDQVQQEQRRPGALGNTQREPDHRHVETGRGEQPPLRLRDRAPIDVRPDVPTDREGRVYNGCDSRSEYVSAHLR